MNGSRKWLLSMVAVCPRICAAGLIVVAVLSFDGCVAMFDKGGTYRAYTGPQLGLDQIAVIKLDNDRGGMKYSGIGVSQIDGNTVHYKFGESIQLLPGTHTITFYYAAPLVTPTSFSAEPITQSVVLLAGKRYRARTQIEQSISSQRMGNTTVYEGRWGVEIIQQQ